MQTHRPFSSNAFKAKHFRKMVLKMKYINNVQIPKINLTYSKSPHETAYHLKKSTSDIIYKSNENLDLLNLMIKSSPNQYNTKKINKKLMVLNPLYIRGTEENLKRPNFNQNTEKVFYKYNLLYGSNTNNLIRAYSPKMRPMSSSINEFNKKMITQNDNNIFVFNEKEIMQLINARCKDIGIKLRDNMIYKFKTFFNSKCRNRYVNLSDCYLGIYSISLIAKFIYNNDRIAKLNLTKNNLGDHGVELLINAIKNSTSLILLNITSNSITYKGGQIIFENLANQQSIIDLNISTIEGSNRNYLTSLGVKNIDNYFNLNWYIETLNLAGNSIKDEGFIQICKGLDCTKNLKKLNLATNDIQYAGLSKGLSLVSSCKIFSLNLSNNKILDSGIKILTNSLQNFPNLNELSLSNCGFEFNGFQYLIKLLSDNKTPINKLNISGNYLKHKNFESISTFLESLPVKNLNISKCSLGNESTFILGECISMNENIKKINISENKISDAGFKSFTSIFATNHNIESFNVSKNLITDVSAKTFITNMKNNHSLKKINFFDNQLSNIMGNLFLEILDTNITLRNVNLLLNKVQVKTMDEINKKLKHNYIKEKAKYIPDLHKNIKNLKFKPELFKFYEQSIKNKKSLQNILYRTVKQNDKYFSKLIDKEHKKIDMKINKKQDIDEEINQLQKNIKIIMQKISALQDEAFDKEKELEKKIENEKKIFKKYKDENDLLKMEFNATKKSLNDIINETMLKHKKSLEKLNLAEITVNSKMKEINKKREILANLNDPDNLVPISFSNIKKNISKIDPLKEKLYKSGRFLKKATFNLSSNLNNILSEQNMTGVSTSTNENILTNNSYDKNKKNEKDNLKKQILKKAISKV